MGKPMDRIHALIASMASVSSLIVLGISAYLVLALFSFSAYPHYVWLWLPWGLGVLGVAGLLGSLGNVLKLDPVQLRLRVVLLLLGILGAALFLIVFLPFAKRDFPGVAASTWLLLAFLFPAVPIIAAFTGTLRLTSAWKQHPLHDRRKLWRHVSIALSLPLLLVALRLTAQEAVMLWYGHDLTDRALASAESMTDGEQYLIIGPNGQLIESFHMLQPRSILISALQKRFGFKGFNQIPTEAHFGIVADEQAYWWSFRQGSFKSLPGYTGNEFAIRQVAQRPVD